MMSDRQYKAAMLRIVIHSALKRREPNSRTHRDIKAVAEYEVRVGRQKVMSLLNEIENDLIPIRIRYEES